ncbi:ATP-grasp domain-containing protein [Krasilnikovia sp. MM14-A1259]|uniref:ATP-grasp domain-containing protein n=1 Tax=Krasilnikovia sp. MM14-A1259 TaxID=3373539 RepID=UPI0037F5E090
MTSDPSGPATRERSRVALVTSDHFPDLYADDHPLRAALRARGVAVDAVCWDDPAADWAAYDLAVLRSTWDYPPRRDAFVAWAGSVPRLANPADIVAWNTDKHYLRDLAEAGVPVTPTRFVEPGEAWTAPAAGEWVVKPAISIGSRDSGRYRLPEQSELAQAHVARLGAAGRTAMVQPYLAAVDTVGETAVLCTPDKTGALRYSHAVRKDALLHGPDAGSDPSAYRQEISSREAGEAELAVAALALAAIPGGADRLLYARVDLIPGPDGRPLLVELELTEPSLFLLYDDGAADRLADAILDRLPRS